MQPELHERARLLLDRGMMESIPAEKQRWSHRAGAVRALLESGALAQL